MKLGKLSNDDFEYLNPKERDVRSWLVIQIFLSAADMVWWTITLPLTLLFGRTNTPDELGVKYDKLHRN